MPPGRRFSGEEPEKVMALAEVEIPSNVEHYEFELDGDDRFAVIEFSFRTGLSEVGELNVQLFSKDTSIDPASFLHKHATLKIKCGTEADRKYKYFHGIVARFHVEGVDSKASTFRALVVPKLWKLSQRRRSRVHVTDRSQNKTIKEVIQKVLDDNGLSGSNFKIELSGKYEPYSFLVQYRESDLDFLKRICAADGVTFFVDHTDKEDMVVFVDSNQPFKPAEPYDEVLFLPSAGAMMDQYESVTQLTAGQSVEHGAIEFRTYDFKKSQKKIVGQASADRDQALENYDFPIPFEDQEDATTRMKKLSALERERRRVAGVLATGRGSYRSLFAGKMFSLSEHPVEALNRKWLCVSAEHKGSQTSPGGADDAPTGMGGSKYEMKFSMIPAEVVFRPPQDTPAPKVQGVQTATVVGEQGAEIWTEPFGRIKVQFHWDRENEPFGNQTSFWVRVAHMMAGRKWGAMFLPRVGQEVLIDFIDGNPNQPVVVGCMYNDYQRVPYALPEHQTRSTIKTNSTPGGEGFNELRFEDKKDQEQIFLHAERNLDVRVKADRMESVVGNRHLTVGSEKDGESQGDQKDKVFGFSHRRVLQDHDEQVEGDYKLTVGKGKVDRGEMDLLVAKDKRETVEGKSHCHVQGDWITKYDQDVHVQVGKDRHEKIGMTHATDAGMTIHLKAGMNVVIEGGMQLTLKGAGGFISIDPMGVTIQGTLVNINSGGAPGAGPGARPEGPTDAKKAEPKDPAGADDDKSGEKSTWQ